MARRMVEKEKHADLLGLIGRLTKRLEKSSPSKSDEERRKEAIKKIEEFFSRNPDRLKEEGESAKEWTKKAREDDPALHAEAEQQARRQSYGEKVFGTPSDHLTEVKQILADKAAKAPDFLHVDEISYSKEAAEFAGYISLLPKELQDNPHFLYKEAAKLYWSTKWTEATPEVVREVRGLLDRTFDHIRTDLAPASPDFAATNDGLIEGFDRRFDLYRTKRLPSVTSSGTKPDKGDIRSSEEWRQKRVREKQHNALDNTLLTFQKQLDLSENSDPKRQEELLRKLADKLINGNTDGRYDRETEGDMTFFNSAETTDFITQIQDRRNIAKKMVDFQESNERRHSMIEQGRIVEFTADMKKRYRNDQTPLGAIVEFRKLSKKSADLIKSGVDGEEEWFSNFWNDIFNTGKEQAHPDLEEYTEWSDFKNLMGLLYGDRAKHRIATLADRWNSVGKFAAVEKFLFNSKGDPKTKLEAIAGRTPDEMHWLHTSFLWSEYTESQYKRVMGDLMQVRTNEFLEARKWLRAEITPEEHTWLQAGVSDLLAELTQESQRTGYPITHDSLLAGLQQRYATVDRTTHDVTLGSLSPELDNLRINVQTKRDQVGRGVYLLDSDMRGQSALYQEMSYQQATYDATLGRLVIPGVDEATQGNLLQQLVDSRMHIDEIDIRLRDPSLPHAQRLTLQNQKNSHLTTLDQTLEQLADPNIPVVERKTLGDQLMSLDLQLRENWKKYTHNPYETRGPNSKELTALAGYSPVEIRVRDRVLAYLKEKSLTDPTIPYPPPEWRMREAIWAARQAQLGWGDAIDFAARTARAPVYDLMSSTTAKLGDPKGEDVMPAAFLEPIIRIINPDLFRDRFQMGGKAGDALFDYYYSIMFKKFGYKIEEDASPLWKSKLKEAKQSGKSGWWRVYLEYAEDELNIPYSELLRPGFLHTGMELTNTTWRAHLAIIEPRRKEFMEMRAAHKIAQDAPLDNVALGIQLTATDVKKDVRLRYKLLDKMTERTPSVYMTHLGEDMYHILENHNIDPQGKEWRLFQDGLSNAEMKLWDNELISTQRVNLAEQVDFERFVKPSLTAMGIPEQETGKFREVIKELQDKLREGDLGKTRLDKWAKHAFPLTVTTSDFNWKKTRSDLLGMYTNERRMNDVLSMAESRDMQNKIFTTSELYSPVNFSDTFKALREYETTVNKYDSTDTAEKATAPILETLLEFNRNRAIHGPWGYIPGAVSLMKRLGETEPEHIPILKWIPGWGKAMEEHGLRGKKWNEWPMTIGDAVSGSVRWTGREGNALDEFRIAGLLAEAREMGMFTNNPQLVGELERQFRTGFLWRILGTGRKYWWVVPLATIVVAAGHSIEEEKKKTSH